jgi:uracil DNA glycosylase
MVSSENVILSLVYLLNQLMGFVAEERKHYTVYPPPHQVFTWTQMCDIRDVSTLVDEF